MELQWWRKWKAPTFDVCGKASPAEAPFSDQRLMWVFSKHFGVQKDLCLKMEGVSFDASKNLKHSCFG